MPFRKVLRGLSKRTLSQEPNERLGATTHPVAAHDDPSNEYGLHPLGKLSSPSEASPVYAADIVFVHGLNGHWRRTWTHGNGTFWPQDLLLEALPGARIFSYGYPSQIFANKSVAGIDDFAKHLLSDIQTQRNKAANSDGRSHSRPIMYICHSLGGIVVKQALIIAYRGNEFRDIRLSTKSVMFMGTPHRGSGYATTGKMLGKIANFASLLSLTHSLTGGVKTNLIEALSFDNKQLWAISTDFLLMAQESALPVISVYETAAPFGANNRIVEDTSAILRLKLETTIPLYLSHQDLCRFFGHQDDNYKKILDLIKSKALKVFDEGGSENSSLCTDYSFDETEKKCASILNTIDLGDYQRKLGIRVEGTLEWILREPQYQAWASDSNARLLWVTGHAGSGKTMLASFVWQKLEEQNPRALTCRFFCDEKNDEYRDPRGLLRSIIFQIVNKRRRLWRIVRKASDAGGYIIFNQFDALWHLFKKLARSEAKYPITIIIDAIDELEPKVQHQLIEHIKEFLGGSDTTPVKFLITSKLTAKSESAISVYSKEIICLSMQDKKFEIDTDIRIVIHFCLEQMQRDGICPRKVRDALEPLLVVKAGQTFLWIKLVLQVLEKRSLLLEAEVESIADSLPSTLASLYKHLLLSMNEAEQALAAKILGFLVVCARPLTIHEIGIIITTETHRGTASSLSSEPFMDQKSIRSLLGPLIQIHDGRIELIHQSLGTYLTELSRDIHNPLAMRFGVDKRHYRRELFRACSIYLSLVEFQQDVHLTLDPAVDGTTDIRDIEEGTKRFLSPNEESNSGERVISDRRSMEELDLFDEPMFKEDLFADESTWTAVIIQYSLFDYAALYWASEFVTCNEIATREDTSIALALCKTDSAQLRNWFHYHWYRRMPFESVPRVIDGLMVMSFFGHRSSLRVALDSPGRFDRDTLSRALYWASREGHSACLPLLLHHPCCNPQIPADQTQIPLLAAAQFGNLDCLRILLDDSPRVDVNQQDKSGRTALSLAVSGNHNDIVNTLLKHEHTNVNLQDNQGNTPLHMAIESTSDLIFAQLIADKRTEIGKQDKRERSVLSWAAELDAIKSATIIFQKLPILIDQQDHRKRTPLSYAAEKGHLNFVKSLIEDGNANVLIRDSNGRNAHSWAANCRESDVLCYLLHVCPQGADVPDCEGWTPAAWSLDPPEHLENLIILLHSGHVNINQKDNSHGSILSWITRYGHIQMALKVINFPGVDLESPDRNGRTILSIAAGYGCLAIVQMLIATGRTEIDSRDRDEQTPLLWAAKGGDKDVVELLLAAGAEADTSSTSGETALSIARTLSHNEIVELLEG